MRVERGIEKGEDGSGYYLRGFIIMFEDSFRLSSRGFIIYEIIIIIIIIIINCLKSKLYCVYGSIIALETEFMQSTRIVLKFVAMVSVLGWITRQNAKCTPMFIQKYSIRRVLYSLGIKYCIQ